MRFNAVRAIFRHRRFEKYASLVRGDLRATYSRDLHKWLFVAPLIGVLTGLTIAASTLDVIWPHLLRYYLLHHWAIVPGLVAGFLVTGLIMQFLTPDPNEHSTEEIVRSYHEHQGRIVMRPFLPKLIAAITTVGTGGSAALEGPSIYGGGALGSWLWARLRRFGLEPRDRRIMLISGAAAGMAAVFRAPLTGLVFALEMPYKDDLAHEALLPSLIASVVSYATLIWCMGAGTLFDFEGGTPFSANDLLWSALLGAGCGLVGMGFDMAFRHSRSFAVGLRIPHWVKLTVGGLLTGLCGLLFVSVFPGSLIPLGPNYEAVNNILLNPHFTSELLAFAALKLAATLFSLGSGGVSAMFVPLFLTGGALGKAFGQSVVHSPSVDLYAAVGMAAFIASGYKTPLTAVIFVAEATGGHSYIIPTLIGAAVAYAVSGEASISADQRLHETAEGPKSPHLAVREVMQRQVIAIPASATLQDFSESVCACQHHVVFPVQHDHAVLGTISIRALAEVDRNKWSETRVGDLADRSALRVAPHADVREALRLLHGSQRQHMLLVTCPLGKLEGVVTRSDILAALDVDNDRGTSSSKQR
jgi:CIC family chloride channel protein